MWNGPFHRMNLRFEKAVLSAWAVSIYALRCPGSEMGFLMGIWDYNSGRPLDDMCVEDPLCTRTLLAQL